MKTFPAGLDTLLNTGVYVMCDLYTITTVDGLVLRYTSADRDITDGTNTWTSKNILFDKFDARSTANWTAGLDVGSWVVHVMPLPADPVTGAAFPAQIGSIPWLQAVCAGALDAAQLQVDRAYWDYWPPIDFIGTLGVQPAWAARNNAAAPITARYVLQKIFFGRISTVMMGRDDAVISANDFREYLTTAVPVHIFQAGCRHTLYDVNCTLVQASFGINCSINRAGSVNNILNANVPSAPPGSATFALGQVRFTSGLNNGLRVSVRSWTGPGALSVFTLLRPMRYAVSIGDTFTAFAGCDKRTATCTAFGNLVNFGGQPDIPAPEVMSGASASTTSDMQTGKKFNTDTGVKPGGEG